jgi:hypothetical protein
MRRATVLAVLVALVSLWVVVAAGITAVWLTHEARVFGLVMLPTVIVASLLVLYFDWRGRLRQHVLADREEFDDAA